MRTVRGKANCVAAVVAAMLWLLCMTAAADSGDNSLYDLGLENAVSVTPEFYYSTLEYDVVVPAGTTELLLTPVTSNSEARVTDISGAELDEEGNATVYVTVEAPNGAQVSYTLHVTSEAEPETEAPQTEKDKEKEQQEELQRQSESEANARREAELNAARGQIQTLLAQNDDLTKRLNLLMYVLYGLIGFAVVLLFIIINQTLRNKDLKDDLKEAKNQAEMNNEFARKEQTVQNSYYYNTPQAPVQDAVQSAPAADATRNVEAAFGNAPQVLHAMAEAAPLADEPLKAAEAPKAVPEPKEEPEPAKAEGGEPTLVKGDTEEPDVTVEMVDL